MDRFEFYKELNSKEDERKNEINNSLSLPIGIITGLVAALLYLLTNFDFTFNLYNTIIFSGIILTSIVFLIISIYHLIKAYANFHHGYGYDYLADANDLELYYQKLKAYYSENPNLPDITDEEFKQYIFGELVKNTDKNQKNNKTKSFHRYICQKHLITTLLILCVIIFPFSYNYALKKEKKQSVFVEFKSPTEIKIGSKENINFVDSLILKFKAMAKEEKPTPPPSQTIKEGQDPNIRPQTTQNPNPQTTQTSGGKSK